MAKRTSSSYRPLGVALRSFAQRRIRSYVPGGDLASRQPDMPPSWAPDAQTPLNWAGPAAVPATTPHSPTPAPEPPSAWQPPPAPAPVAAPPAEVARMPDSQPAPVEAPEEQAEWSRLGAIMRAHEKRSFLEKERLAAETAAVAAQRAAAGDTTPPGASLQRMTEEDREILQQPGTRRRPAAVMEVTPPKPTGIFDERLWDAPPEDLGPEDAPDFSAPENASSEVDATPAPVQRALDPDTAAQIERAETVTASSAVPPPAPVPFNFGAETPTLDFESDPPAFTSSPTEPARPVSAPGPATRSAVGRCAATFKAGCRAAIRRCGHTTQRAASSAERRVDGRGDPAAGRAHARYRVDDPAGGSPGSERHCPGPGSPTRLAARARAPERSPAGARWK